MTEKEIKLAREKYSQVVSSRKKENLRQMKNELSMLEQNYIVKRYIELKNEITTVENEINNPKNISFAFDEISLQTKKSSNLYLSIGYFSIVTSLENFVSLSEDNPNIHYKYYINVETGKLDVISLENVKKFEEDNIVVDSKLVLTKKGKGNFFEKLNQIRNVYFNYLLEEEQQIAIQKTKKKVENYEV